MSDPKITSPLLHELEARKNSLKEQLTEVYLGIEAEKMRLVEELYGVKVGSIVSCKGTEYRVTSIDASWRDKPWLSGNPRRLDGTFGTAHRNLYNYWELVSTNPTN